MVAFGTGTPILSLKLGSQVALVADPQLDCLMLSPDTFHLAEPQLVSTALTFPSLQMRCVIGEPTRGSQA